MCNDSLYFWLSCAGYDLCSLDGSQEVLAALNPPQKKKSTKHVLFYTATRPINTPLWV